ncbi:MAG: hypothetical protein E6J14_09245 [Chloroflexi bacterium]|nr:MAG: hypothetical protein E6J14_09245 [Chloroflexota bacterium]
MAATGRQAIVISGVPGTGKSTFAGWLQRERGFTHVDADHGGLNRPELRKWLPDCQAPSADVEPFCDALRALGERVVLDWGFPVVCLPVIRAIHAAGVTAWWFDGDRAAARKAFIERRTASVNDLDRQMAAIARHEAELAIFYEDRLIYAVAEDGTFAPPLVVFQTIFKTECEV